MTSITNEIFQMRMSVGGKRESHKIGGTGTK